MYWSYPYGMISSQPAFTQQQKAPQQPTQQPVGQRPIGQQPVGEGTLARFPFSEEAYQANVGRRMTTYMTYEGSKEWLDMKFTGILRQVGRDYLILSDESRGADVILFTVNLDFIELAPGEPACLPPGLPPPTPCRR
jgi:spore germination protein Q